MSARAPVRIALCSLLMPLTLVVVSGAARAAETASTLASVGLKLPYESTNKHLGVATCSSSVCHGNVKATSNYDVQLNEYITWSHEDSHAKAYSVLFNDRSRSIAAKLGLPAAHTAKICLDCHADNVPENLRGKEFNLADGVGCEACHGGAERWIEAHTSKKTTYEQNLKRGMYATADLPARAPLCLSCHVGNADKFASHRIMGAGHPRLSFELDTFQALQPAHYVVDRDYAARKPTNSRTATWAYGQIEAARMQLRLVQQHFSRDGATFPELALFSCHSCHESSMHRLDWARGLTTVGNAPGSVPLADGHLRMALVIARQADAAAARDILSMTQALQEASAESRERVMQISGRLESVLRQFEATIANRKWSPAQQAGMLMAILDMGSKRDFRDYIGAEQAVMAVELIMIDLGSAERQRTKLDALFRLVENDEAYRAEPFVASIDQLRVALGGAPLASSAGVSNAAQPK